MVPYTFRLQAAIPQSPTGIAVLVLETNVPAHMSNISISAKAVYHKLIFTELYNVPARTITKEHVCRVDYSRPA